MLELLIIADDFTGALDTAIQFSKRRILTSVCADESAFMEVKKTTAQVYVVNTDSRHMAPNDAYLCVKRIAERAAELGIDNIYKKTDSGLRGNIGKEISAVIDVYKKPFLCFAPAYPGNGRTTVAGIQYYRGTPVSETEYGQDPFDPVDCSDIARIIHRQSDIKTTVVPAGGRIPEPVDGNTVYICDAQTESDLESVWNQISDIGSGLLIGGCAGFAECVAKAMSPGEIAGQSVPRVKKLLVVSGSLNPVSQKQLNYMELKGIRCVPLYEDEELSENFVRTPKYDELVKRVCNNLDKERVVMLKSEGRRREGVATVADDEKIKVSQAIAVITEGILNREDDCGLVVFGGDTLVAIINRAYCGTIQPLAEIDVGVPLSKATRKSGKKGIVVTKSGGFGEKDVLDKICNNLIEKG